MARGGTSIGDLAYYGAIGGGGWIAYKLALGGELGCQAYQAMAQIYTSVKNGQVPPAPRPDTPAGKDPKCKGGLPGAPAPSQPAQPTAPAPAAPPAAPAPVAPPPAAAPAPSAPAGPPFDDSLVHSTSLVDRGGFPVAWDGNAYAFRQDPDQGGTNFYGVGQYFVDQNQARWTWVGPELVLVPWDGSDPRPISDFFTS